MNQANRIARAHITMAAVYLVVALLSLLDYILALFGIIQPLGNLYWFRLHLITIGVLAQAVMGVLPLLLARRLNVRTPSPTALWILFGLLNVGLLLLAFGQVLWIAWQRSSGAWILLVTLSVWLGLLVQMWFRAPRPRAIEAAFYLAGPAYLLLGVLMALTMLEGWPSPQGYQAVKESHVHNNIFGFTGMVFAGVALDVLPALFGRSLARPGWVKATFWLMVVGAFALWLGPYFRVTLFMGGGLLLYVAGTLLMLANVFLTLRRPTPVPAVNATHFLASYLWIAAPAIATLTFVILGPERLQLARLELGVTQGLVYGLILQIVLAFLPAMSSRILAGQWNPPIQPSEGSRFSLILLNLSVAAVWLASVLLPWSQARSIVAIAYVLVIVAALPYLWRLLRVLRTTRTPLPVAVVQV